MIEKIIFENSDQDGVWAPHTCCICATKWSHLINRKKALFFFNRLKRRAFYGASRFSKHYKEKDTLAFTFVLSYLFSTKWIPIFKSLTEFSNDLLITMYVNALFLRPSLSKNELILVKTHFFATRKYIIQ